MKNILFLSALILFFGNCKPSTISSNNDNIDDKNKKTSYSLDAFPKLKNLVSVASIYTPFINSSFENNLAGHSTIPKGWNNCGEKLESPPDIHNSFSKYFKVTQSPYHGKKYVGLVIRDTYTREKLNQNLQRTLKKGEQYSFSLYASRSENYVSLSKSTMREETKKRRAIFF